MKKKSLFFAMCIGWMLNVMPVHADLIWEPMEDPFYAEYAHECEYENRTYIVKADKVTVYESPLADKAVDVWEKGKAAYISFVYEDEKGEVWGIYDNGDVTQSGWVLISELALKYDSHAFLEEFAQQIIEESVVVKGDAEAKVVFWTYPGAKTKSDLIVGQEGLMLHQTFTDEVGHKWAYVGYFMGMRNCWVCVDAPMASYEELYPNGAPQRGVILEGTEIAVVDGTQYMVASGQTEGSGNAKEDAAANSAEADDSVHTGAPLETKTAEVSTNTKSQIPFVAGIVAGVVVMTGGLLALLKRSFHTNNTKK